MWLLYYLKFIRWFDAAPCISRLHLKGFHAAPIVFEVTLWLHATPCISRLNLKDLHTTPVVFEVYTVAPCDSMRLHAFLDFI